MRALKNTFIIGIDHGYGNIKTANTVMPTGITAYRSEPTFSGNILRYNNTYYRIGEGHKEFISDKSADSDFYLFTLAAIAMELSKQGITSADVHIAAGLPLTWVKNQREDFRKYLLQNEIAKFDFKDKHFKIHIVGCSVFPQGYTAVINQLPQMTGINMLADIGNGTMNICTSTIKNPLKASAIQKKLV